MPPPSQGKSLNVIALISGGKDSLYTILHCIRNGHNVVALANLHPPLTTTTKPASSNNNASDQKEKEEQGKETGEDDIDSFMYQTVGWGVIPLYESALGIPLYRAPICGGAVDTGRGEEGNEKDETESLLPLLHRIKSAHPEANAICAGAILSTYQRTRIENVAGRLGLTPLAWLWMYPFLPAPEERGEFGGGGEEQGLAGLLEDMAAVGCSARIIKVASGALDEGFLWGDVSGSPFGRGSGVRGKIVKGMKRFVVGDGGEDIRGAVLGEGGEYETLAVDGPGFLWKGRIELEDEGREVRIGEGGVAYLRLNGARVVMKGGEGEGDGVTPERVRRPVMLDGGFAAALDRLRDGDWDEEEGGSIAERTAWQLTGPVQSTNGGIWTVSNITAPEAGPGAAEQMAAIAKKIQEVLDTAVQEGGRTTADIVFTTVLLRSMADFPMMNSIYVSLFQKPNPPARATVACGDTLPDGVNVMISMVVDLGPRVQRNGLHVQSRSYWAPANIGPYSQAMSVPLQGTERVVYIAGQIPLEPASMDLIESPPDVGEPSWVGNYRIRAVLSLQHMWRIGIVMEVGWWLGAVAFFTGKDHIRARARLAWKLWEKMHKPDIQEEEEEEESTLDAWDIKYGRRGHEQIKAVTGPRLPNFDLVEADGCMPAFFAVQVHELPRNSDVEWQGLGYRCGGMKLAGRETDFGRATEVTTNENQRYSCIEVDKGAPGFDLKTQIQRVLEVYTQPGGSHCVIYSSQPLSLDWFPGQVVPCKSVWGAEGRELAAGLITMGWMKLRPMLGKHLNLITYIYGDMAYSTSQEDEGPPPNVIPPDSDLVASDNLRSLSRSPLPHSRNGSTQYRKRTSSDSGTEADDESTSLLKGLPAPPARPRKGARPSWNGGGDHDLWLPGLQRWPSLARSTSRSSRRSSVGETEVEMLELRERLRAKRRIEIVRRGFEAALLLSVGGVVLGQQDVRSLAWSWRKELISYSFTVIGLYALYPLNRHGRLRLSRLSSFVIPPSFDPAPLLYPILIPVYVSLSLSNQTMSLLLPNILLALASIPPQVIPMHELIHGHSVIHWMFTLVPVIVSEQLSWGNIRPGPLSLRGLDSEVLTLVFPLHQALIPTLDFLLTTSILPAELQLLTTALINLFLFASSPQAEILKALLWLGSLCIFISCRQVLHWEVALARIPSWKFRRSLSAFSSPKSILNYLDQRICQKLSRAGSSEEPTSDSDSPDGHLTSTSRRTAHEPRDKSPPESPNENATREDLARRHGSTQFDDAVRLDKVKTTPRGRRKRLMAPDMASFLSMTIPQVQVRKWLYAFYVYLAVLAVIFGPVRKYVGDRALQGEDPFGWALGYLLGNISWFRFWVITSSLEYWIPIPPRLDDSISNAFCHLGRAEQLRHGVFGEASTRLLITAYCLVVLVTGIAVVIRLGTYAEVDTRRKVFHGTMVMMFLPTIYIDPTFCALAMALALAIFLLMDLFRASQLPPISRPLTYFLAPYVDGRDYRGPVIVSHIFLLVGSSIPLWLALADVSRTGEYPWKAWDAESRDVSMVSGIICVGLGDAAASLIGRRFGRRKWFWGGGKSIEGSVAFAVAVTAGSMFAQGWLALGQWPVSRLDGPNRFSWPMAMTKAVFAAGGASATEAVLTGCNDNVVVPIVLWLLVRGLGL
ncbi:hypothetical protein BDW59DRAFT_171402 [Aspergillus cavernicola]|uniref:Diphthine--ammonia ligase n=1 Tax=Aspergillus cavernicola TaxID=176166 RepID=A0ABR4II12_9EURO